MFLQQSEILEYIRKINLPKVYELDPQIEERRGPSCENAFYYYKRNLVQKNGFEYTAFHIDDGILTDVWNIDWLCKYWGKTFEEGLEDKILKCI